MIRRVYIDEFRGIEKLDLRNLGELTILTGVNGCGKSTVLDALLIAAHPSPGHGIANAVDRHPLAKTELRFLFRHGRETSARIAIHSDSARNETRLERDGGIDTVVRGVRKSFTSDSDFAIPLSGGGTEAAVSVEVVRNPLGELKLLPSGGPLAGYRPVTLIDPGTPEWLAHTYSKAADAGHEAAIDELIGAMFNDFEGLRVSADSINSAFLTIKRNGFQIPLPLAGDGIQAAIQILIGIAAHPNGVVLIEEPEVFQHPRALRVTAKAIREGIKRGLQIVLTTHSIDLIDALIEGDESTVRDSAALFIVRRRDGKHDAIRYAGDEIVNARKSIELDLR